MAAGHWHRIRAGEGTWDLAVANGLSIDRIWLHSENAKLRRLRENPNVLFPGDRVFVPDLTPRQETASTEATHRFRRKNVPLRIHLRFLRHGRPRANVPWTLQLGVREYRGETDGGGHVHLSIPPGHPQGTMWVGPDDDIEEFILRLGYLDPVEQVVGIQQRLRNLGYSCPTTGELGETTRAALRSFQIQNDLKVSGEADRYTINALKRLHGA